MISSRLTRALAKLSFRLNCLVGGRIGEHVMLRPAGLGLAAASRSCWRVAPPCLAIFSIKRGHFLPVFPA